MLRSGCVLVGLALCARCLASGQASPSASTPQEARQGAVPTQSPVAALTTTPPNVSRVPFPTGPGTPLGSRVATLLNDPQVAAAHWGVAVTAMDGTPIYGMDEGKLFRPASTAKLFTTGAAMALLGPDARVETRLTYTGTIGSDGTLDGYLTLRGAGDANLSGVAGITGSAGPTASSPGNPMAVLDQFAAAVAAKGIRKVRQVQVGGWLWDPYPQGWGVDDRTYGFGAPVTGFVLNDNTVALTVEPGARAGENAKVSVAPAVRGVQPLGTVNTVPAGAPAGLLLHDWPNGQGPLVIGGSVAVGKPVHGTVAVPDPSSFVENAFLERLSAHGVEATFLAPSWATSSDTRSFGEITHDPVALPGAPTADGAGDEAGAEVGPAREQPCNDGCLPLASHTSGTLAEDVTLTLKESQNLHAEVMLRRLGAAFGRDNTFAQGVRVMRQFWTNAGLDPDTFVFYDGSGLSARDLVMPRTETQLLVYAAKQPWFPQWEAALPVGGVDGTLASRFTAGPLKGHVLAKTGTMGETSVLAGYVLCASGREVIFSVMVDNHEPGNGADRVAMDKVVEAIAAMD